MNIPKTPRRLDVLGVFAARGISILTTFLLSVVVARTLGPEQSGIFFLVFALIALLATAARFGTDSLALRLVGGDSRTARSDVSKLFAVVLVVGVLVALASALIIPIFVSAGLSVATVLLVASSVLALALAVLAGAILRGVGRLASGVFSELGSLPTLATLGILILNRVQSNSASLEAVIAILVAASWATAAWSVPLAIVAARSRLTDQVTNDPSRSFFRHHFGRLLPMMSAALLAYAMVWAPVFVLSATGSVADVAFYTVAMRIANIVGILPTIQISYLAPAFVRHFYADEIDQLNALAGRSATQTLALTALPLFILIGFAPQVMSLIFGDDFTPAASLMVILCLGVFIAMAGGQVSQLMLLCGLERTALLLSAGALLVWATVGFWVSAVFGAQGAAWIGAIVTVLFALCGSMALLRRREIRSFARFGRS